MCDARWFHPFISRACARSLVRERVWLNSKNSRALQTSLTSELTTSTKPMKMFSLLVLLATQVLLEDLWSIRVTIIVPDRQPGDSEDIKTTIFYIYVPQGMFWGSTSRPNIWDLVMNLVFNLGSNVHDWGWLKDGPFWTKNGQRLQASQRSKAVQKGPKWSI